jgi:hypothetical protein
MLSQQVRKGLIGKLLKVLHAISRQQIKGVPCLTLELDALARHLVGLQAGRSSFKIRGLGVPSQSDDPTRRRHTAISPPLCYPPTKQVCAVCNSKSFSNAAP